MSPALITLILSLVQEAIVLEPQIASQLQALFAKQNPTPADWETLRQNILAKTYKDYVPASALPASTAPTIMGSGKTSPTQPNAPISQPGAISTAKKPTVL